MHPRRSCLAVFDGNRERQRARETENDRERQLERDREEAVIKIVTRQSNRRRRGGGQHWKLRAKFCGKYLVLILPGEALKLFVVSLLSRLHFYHSPTLLDICYPLPPAKPYPTLPYPSTTPSHAFVPFDNLTFTAANPRLLLPAMAIYLLFLPFLCLLHHFSLSLSHSLHLLLRSYTT